MSRKQLIDVEKFCHFTGLARASSTPPVVVSRWDVTRRYSESIRNFHERHNSKKEAEEAARRMLADKSQFFSAEYSVEANVICDLEWCDVDK